MAKGQAIGAGLDLELEGRTGYFIIQLVGFIS